MSIDSAKRNQLGRIATNLNRMGLTVLWMVCLALFSPVHAADRLDTIRAHGVLIVGVKTDYPPFGMLTTNAEHQGLEHDLAVDLAQRLGVQLRTVGVNTTNRLQVLDDGRVDVTIATLGDTAERRQIATLIEPDYYSSGVSLMTRPDSPVQRWSDLRGQTVCATQGSYFNRTMVQRDLLKLQLYANGRDAKLAVRDRRCVGWLFDNTAIAGDLLTSEWHGYRIALPPELVAPWAIAVARGESSATLARFIGDTVAQWHRDGTLLALEKKWGLPPSSFLLQMHALWSAKDPDGQYRCRRLADDQWPVACRNQIFVTSTNLTGLRRWGLWLNEKTGINLTYLYDDYERTIFLHGIALTLALTSSCLGGSLATALVLVWLTQRGPHLIAVMVRGYASLARMTPPLLQIYLLFFGVGSVASAHWGIRFNAFWIVVSVLSLYTGAGLMNVLDHAADEARTVDACYVVNVHALARLLAESSTVVSASLVNVAKATMMASAVAVPELLSVSTYIVAEHGNVGTMMNTLMVFFVFLIFCVLSLLQWAQRRGAHVRT